jgi:thiol:disulfide interchange protein DsbG
MSIISRVGHLHLLAGILIVGVFICTPAVHAQEVDQATLQAHWSQLKTADWIAEGASKPQHVLYEIFDPNCYYCHELWGEMQSQYQHGVQIRYILVGIISDTSPTKAAAILEAANPVQALKQNETEWGQNPDGSSGGGIEPLTGLDFSMRLKLMMHFKLARDFGIFGTPGLIWQDDRGKVHVLQSAPLPEQLAQVVKSANEG